MTYFIFSYFFCQVFTRKMNKTLVLRNLSTVLSNKNISSNYSIDQLLLFLLNNKTSSIRSSANSTATATSVNGVVMMVLEWLNLYYLGAIIIIGVLGNAINFFAFILRRMLKKKNFNSPSYYLASLALNDTIFLLTILIIWLNHFGVDLFDRDIFHELTVYLSSTSSCMSGKRKTSQNLRARTC